MLSAADPTSIRIFFSGTPSFKNSSFEILKKNYPVVTSNLRVRKRIYNFVEFRQTYFPPLFCFLSMRYRNSFFKGLDLINEKQKIGVVLGYTLDEQCFS